MKLYCNLYLLPILFLLFVSCGNRFGLHHDYDPEVHFESIETFAFSKEKIDNIATMNDLDKRRILRAIDSSLVKTGLDHSKTPNIVVDFSVKKIQNNYQSLQPTIGWGFNWGPLFWNTSQPMQETRHVLTISIANHESKALIWEGSSFIPLGRHNNNPVKRNELFKNMVTRIMSKYPPGKEEKKEYD